MAAGPSTEAYEYVDLEKRALDSFGRIEVKPPFTTEPRFGHYRPTPQQLGGVAFRLRQLRPEPALLSLDDSEFDRLVLQVWELVRWIHTDDELKPVAQR